MMVRCAWSCECDGMRHASLEMASAITRLAASNRRVIVKTCSGLFVFLVAIYDEIAFALNNRVYDPLCPIVDYVGQVW